MGRFYPAGSNGGKRMGEAGARMRIRSGRFRMGAGEPTSRFEANDARRFAAAVWRFGDSCSHRDPGSRARLVRVARDAASEMLRYAAQVGLTPPPDRGSRPASAYRLIHPPEKFDGLPADS